MDKTYGPKVVCRAVGISQRQLGYWTLIGVIKPTKQAHGSKIFNRYTDQDIETLHKVKKLTEEGFFVSKAAERVHREVGETDLHPPDHLENERTSPSLSRIDPMLSPPGHSGLASSLYLEVRLNEEIAQIRQCFRPLSCLAIRVIFPAQLSFSQERSSILFQVSNILVSGKEPSEVISYKKDATFLWLLPNRTIEQSRRFSKEIKKRIEEPQWEIQGKRFNLKAAFGFGSYSFSLQREGGILAEAEQDLKSQPDVESVEQVRNGTNGGYSDRPIGKNGSLRR